MNKKQKHNLIKRFLCFVDHELGIELRERNIDDEHGDTWWGAVDKEDELVDFFLDEISETENQ